MGIEPRCMNCGQHHFRNEPCPEVIRVGGVSVVKNKPLVDDILPRVDEWSNCPHCKARRDKHNARTKRYRAKLWEKSDGE